MERHYGWVIVAAGAVITCVAMGAMFALPVYLQPMADETGWTRAGISRRHDHRLHRHGRRRLRLGHAQRPHRRAAGGADRRASCSAPACSSPAAPPTCCVFQFAYGGLVGASGGAFFAPIISTTLGWFDKNRSLAVSLVSIGGGVAPMVITPLASVLIADLWLAQRHADDRDRRDGRSSSRPAFLIRRAPARRPARRLRPPDGSRGAGAAAVHRPVAALRTPQFIVLAATFFLCCAAHSGPIFHTVSYAMICGASALAAASIYSVEGVAGPVRPRWSSACWPTGIGVRRVIVGGLALQAVGIYIYIYVTRAAALLHAGGRARPRLWRRDAALLGAGARLFRASA